jgi:hypothetical protein
MSVDDNGGISFYFDGDNGLDSFNGNYDGHGIPKATTGGMHYDGKWNSDKESINANYKIGQLDVNGISNTLTQNNLPGGEINTNSNQSFKNSLFRQKLDLTYLIKLDTSSTLKVLVDGAYKDAKTGNDFATIGRKGPIANDTLLNSNTRTITNDDKSRSFNGSLFYTHKFQKKGRTLSALLAGSLNNQKSEGFLKSEANYYNTKTGILDSTILIDQLKTNTVKNSVFNSNITYTEPLSKAVSLILNYGINVNNGSADKRSYNKDGEAYTDLDSVFSNFYTLNQVSNQVGAFINFQGIKQSLKIGTKISDVSFKQIDEYTGDTFKRNFLNWNPSATYSYKFSQQRSLYLSYYGNTSQPSINQIQPVRVNTDPLNVFLGNQGLTPSFSSNINLNFYDYKVLSDQFINLGGGYTFTSNQIVNSTITDGAGKSTTQYVNLKDKMTDRFYMYGSAGRKTGLWDIYAGLNINANANTSYSYNNNVLNRGYNASYSGGVSISKYIKDKFDFSVNAGPSYNISKSTLQTGGNNNGRGFYTRGNVSVYLPAKFKISSDVNYTYTAPTATFNSDLKRTLLNANISKSFFKANSVKLMISGNDLLNQNVGFERNTYGNMVTQNTYTTIQRYFMFTVTWDFNKMGGGVSK